MKEEIIDYYNDLAKNYDDDRFNNSYGLFIDQQERQILNAHRELFHRQPFVDIACGTGRFMEYCELGVDISPEMLSVARSKLPDKEYQIGNALRLSDLGRKFAGVLCFHLIMHLEKDDLMKIFAEVSKVSEKGSIFIFDLPSSERRQLINYQSNGWHGANSYTQKEVQQIYQTEWTAIHEQGILFLPIHRFPGFLRPFLRWVDDLLNKSWLKKYASYRLYILQKK